MCFCVALTGLSISFLNETPNLICNRGFKLLGTVLAVRADDAKEQGDEREKYLWVRAAATKLEGVRAMECIAAGCDGQCDASVRHPVVYQLSLEVLEAGKDLTNALTSDDDALAPLASCVARYIPTMLVMWPHLKSDDSMMEKLNALASIAAEAPPTAP